MLLPRQGKFSRPGLVLATAACAACGVRAGASCDRGREGCRSGPTDAGPVPRVLINSRADRAAGSCRSARGRSIGDGDLRSTICTMGKQGRPLVPLLVLLARTGKRRSHQHVSGPHQPASAEHTAARALQRAE